MYVEKHVNDIAQGSFEKWKKTKQRSWKVKKPNDLTWCTT
jgi:dihydroneopterin aldolase